MKCDGYLRNIQVLLSGKTPYERRFGEPFNGTIIPFGSMVECHPTSAKAVSRLHLCGKEVLPGIFLGYVFYAGESGKETLWSQTLRNWKRWSHQKSMPGDSKRFKMVKIV